MFQVNVHSFLLRQSVEYYWKFKPGFGAIWMVLKMEVSVLDILVTIGMAGIVYSPLLSQHILRHPSKNYG